jgi:hypothetical protein
LPTPRTISPKQAQSNSQPKESENVATP